MVYGRCVTVQKHRQSRNLNVLLTNLRGVGAKAYKNANIAGINTNLAGFCTKYNFSRHKMYFAMHCAYDWPFKPNQWEKQNKNPIPISGYKIDVLCVKDDVLKTNGRTNWSW